MSSSYSGVFKRAGVDGSLDLMDGGYIDLMDGTQPANVNTAITTQNVLATLDLNNPAMSASTGDPPSASYIGPVVGTGVATGTATWARVYTSGDVALFDGTVTLTGLGGEFEINDASVSSGKIITLTGFTYSES